MGVPFNNRLASVNMRTMHRCSMLRLTRQRLGTLAARQHLALHCQAEPQVVHL